MNLFEPDFEDNEFNDFPLDGEDEFEDRVAARRLDPADYPDMINRLLDDKQALPISDVYQLSDMPDAALARFLEGWPNTDVIRREILARHMADICEENFVVDFGPFVPTLLDDPSLKVRLSALDMLWDSTNTRIVPKIVSIMRTDRESEVKASAAATLGHFVMMAQWGEVSSQIEGQIVTALLEQLDEPSTIIPIRRAALESISSSAEPRVPQLIEQAYQDVDSGLNISAVFAMGRSGDSRWVSIVDRELDSDDPEMRAEAVRAAGSIGDSGFTTKLSEIAKYDDDFEVQLAAVHSLGQIGNDEAAQTLADMNDDEGFEALHDVIEEALEEMMMLGIDIDLSLLDFEDGEDEDDFLPDTD